MVKWIEITGIVICGIGATVMCFTGQIGGDALCALYGAILGYIFKKANGRRNGNDS